MNKSTEKGLVPELRFPEFREQGEWAAKQLSELCALQAGKFVRAAEIKENNADGLYPCYGGNGLRGFTATFTHEGKYSLIGRQGALCGNINFVTKKFHATEHAVVVTPKEKINNSWLYYELVRLDLNRFATGQAQPGLSVDNLLKVISSAPKIEKEQQKIADCLSSLDELISAHTQKLDALQAHKKGLMQQLFPAEGETVPKLRFPEFDTEWKPLALSKIGNVITGNTPSTTEKANYGGDKLFVSPADISGKRFITNTKTTLSDSGFSKTRKIPENSILFVCIGSTIGKIAQNRVECATNQQINSVVPFCDFVAGFIYYALERASPVIADLAGKQAVPIINKTLFSSVKLKIPLPKEQQKIASCLSSIDELITAQSQKIEALKAHKKGLMQQLFPTFGGDSIDAEDRAMQNAKVEVSA